MTTYNQPVPSRIWIGSLDEPSLGVNAQYNPKEVSIDKSIPWSQHQKGNTDGLQWEFTGAQGRVTTIDLLFDGVEEDEDILDPILKLQTLAAVRDPGSTDPKMRRPHHCVAVWGSVFTDSQQERFQCVIMQLTVKYTMFNAVGAPLRATATVKLQEATRVSMAQDDDGGSSNGSSTDDNDWDENSNSDYGDEG
jgi:hypothetical protein